MTTTLRMGVLAALALLTACDAATLDPFESEERYFTIWGFLDPEARFQSVRVIPVGRSAERIEGAADPAARIDAQVTLINLDTGREQQWTPTLRANDDSTAFFHVFTARTDAIRQGDRYRLEVRRSDGRMASAETVIPSFTRDASVELAPPTGVPGQVYQQITVPGIGQPGAVAMTYFVGVARFEVPYTREGVGPTIPGSPPPSGPGEVVGNDWVFTANYSTDAPEVIRLLESSGGFGEFSPLTRIGVRIVRSSDDWALIDNLDNPPILQPGQQSNVEGGYGFFGSVGPIEASWEVSPRFGESIGTYSY
ncbi:MAG: hypothetical protein AAGJ10_12350 [Bacteroidota bacterium]